ncbi:MAG: serine/threonine protein kinase, partial [Blastocatellia bacterium]|nr:serine/threonine protein kinase [Blastocatellia bacterium]
MRECSVCSNCYEDHIILCPKDGQALPEPIPIPIIIARKYRIDALIGRGGMGTVYKATQFGLNRSVAIKILRQELLTAGLSVEHLRHEALASSRIDHPNVVTVHDYGTLESGEEYLVMKFIKGYPLSKELRAHGQLSFDRAFGIILQVCSAIEAAHKLSIAHCDLKPDN